MNRVIFMTAISSIIFAGSALACPEHHAAMEKLELALANTTDDAVIADWGKRAATCAHFAGEEAYDEQRSAYIDEQMKASSCETLKCDYDVMQIHYDKDENKIAALEAAMKANFASAQDMPACPPAE